MESLEMKNFWPGKRVIVTGHTGFKGSWLVLMLQQLGATVGGISKDIPTTPSMFELCSVAQDLEIDLRIDINNYPEIEKALIDFKPDIVFHMAAQSLVRKSYAQPIETYQTNVMGTLNVLLATLKVEALKVVVNITTDKCYENKELDLGYKESDPLGGYDPYSSSKACAEILSSSLRQSFFSSTDKVLATARAGNVIGGGDWATDRIIPDLIEAKKSQMIIQLRYPQSIRPWQHVLEPLNGYLMLAKKCFEDKSFGEAWNFGPDKNECWPVSKLAEQFTKLIPGHPGVGLNTSTNPHEAHFLRLDCTKAKDKLKWKPKLTTSEAIQLTANWYLDCESNKNLKAVTNEQIRNYLELK
jgi:CDP-glucose 4,6-dehydratase